jgi:hypothetical protein
MIDRPPVINIDVPKQAPPVVNVEMPKQPRPIVNVEAPIVNVPAHKCPKTWTFEVTQRDKQGRMLEVIATPQY